VSMSRLKLHLLSVTNVGLRIFPGMSSRTLSPRASGGRSSPPGIRSAGAMFGAIPRRGEVDVPTIITKLQDSRVKYKQFVTVVVLSMVLGFPRMATAEYSFTTIDVPDSTSTDLNGNSVLAIAGDFDDADGNTHGFVLSNGVFTQIDVPGANGYTSVNGINASGELAGTYADNAGVLHAFYLSKGAFITLDPPGATESQGGFLNAKGQVVGGYRDASTNHVRHAFVWSKGTFTTIDPPGGNAALGPVALWNQRPGTGSGDVRRHVWCPPRLLAEPGRLYDA
jgi:probable HAF family extracellular repeat protein